MADDDVLMVVDEAGTVVEWCHSAEALLGFSAAEVVGRPATALVPPAGAPGAGDRTWDPGAGVLRHRDGHAVTADLRVRPVHRRGSVAWEIRRAGEAPSWGDTGKAVLDALFTESPMGLHIIDPQLRVVRANMATRALRDVAPERILGRSITDVYQVENAMEEVAVARGVLETGKPVIDRLVRGRARDRQGRQRTYSVSTIRLHDAQGEVLGLLLAVVDVTDRETGQARLRLLASVREAVGRTLDVVTTCQELVDAVVPGFADVAVVEVVDEVVRGEQPPAVPLSRDVPLRRAAFRGLVSAHPVGDVRHLPHGTPFWRALADLRPRLLSLEPDSPWLAADPARAESIRLSQAHTLVVAPLTLRGEGLGVVSLYRCGESEPFDEDDVALAMEICSHTALCIDNARRYTRERTIAATVQRRMLPQHPSTRTALETAYLHLAGTDGGGAWFDIIALPGARTVLVVGDVVGGGIHAATTMGQLRTVIHSLAALDLEPDQLLARLNDTATRLASERSALPVRDPLHREPLTAGCVIALYDPVELTCTIARAAHPAPLLVHSNGAVEELDAPVGPALAGTGRAPFAAATFPLPEGSTLAFRTAALPLDAPPTATALRHLLERSPGAPLQRLCDEVSYTLPAAGAAGDTLLLLARTHAFPADQVSDLTLPVGPEAAPVARAEARRRLEAWGIEEDIAFATELIVSELVGNAVRHGAPPFRLRLILDGTLTSEVSDAGASAPHLRHARTVDESGRGLFIVSQLSEQWGTRYTSEGKTIWAQQLVQPEVPPVPAPIQVRLPKEPPGHGSA